MILADAKNLAFAQGFELVEDEGLLAEVAGPGRMAGGADGLVRRGVPRDPGRGDPRHHPQQPEMLRAARSADGEARQQVHPGREHRGERRRQGHRRRQRARHPRAAVGRQVLLRDRSEDAARRSAAEVRAHRVSREARHAGRAHRAHRGAGRAISRRSVGADVAKAERAAQLCKADLADRGGRRIPRAAGPDGPLLRRGAGRGRSRRARQRGSLQARRGRTTWCRPIRCRSPSRSPTRSTRWSASGRSTRSRPAARTRMRCGVRRSA